MNKINIFLSYCWNDSDVANRIYDYFINRRQIELHRDVIDIKKWHSIRAYMQSISNMDYIILLISDSYLKSANCMYEVLEVMKNVHYKDKVFPAVTYYEIYNPIARAKYVKYWQDQFRELEKTLEGIKVQNIGNLNEDLKQRQDISSNIAEFLDVVSDMNNPNIEDVCIGIEEELNIKGFLGKKQDREKNDVFAVLGMQEAKFNLPPTDIEINKFMRDGFTHIIEILSSVCRSYTKDYPFVQIEIEQVNTRTVIYKLYKNGQLVRSVKIFLGRNMFGRHENIGISEDFMLFGANNNSWNGMYDAKLIDGELKMYATMSLANCHKEMTIDDVVTDIWENYIQIYLEE